jgi:putative Ca2+/H+ antiporter (TMEM165/GDT1 family)
MVGALELVVIAFLAQLAVLPGEKVQFIIAGLATRYPPLLVVGAAGTAFAGWTAIEIAFGAALQGALPTVALDAIAGGLFVLFAVLLVQSAPERGGEGGAFDDRTSTDGGTTVDASEAASDLEVTLFGRQVPDVFGGFLPIFVLMAVGEFGDKTQLVTIGLAVEYGARPAIWVGEMAAIVPVSLANAYLFDRFAHRFDARLAHYLSAALFAFFGLDAFLAIVTGHLLQGPSVSIWESVVSTMAGFLLGQ